MNEQLDADAVIRHLAQQVADQAVTIAILRTQLDEAKKSEEE